MSLTKETSSSDLFRLMCEACRLSVREFPNISVCRVSKGTGVVEHTQVVLVVRGRQVLGLQGRTIPRLGHWHGLPMAICALSVSPLCGSVHRDLARRTSLAAGCRLRSSEHASHAVDPRWLVFRH